jgi:hypothetical protein
MRARIVLLACLFSAGAAAQPPSPVCRPEREGMLACFGTRLCECRYDPGGSLTARPGGYRWDCGPLRPDCGVVPPSLGTAPLEQPPQMLEPLLRPAPMAR